MANRTVLRPRPAAQRARRVLAWLACAWLAGQLAVGAVLDAAPVGVRFRQGGKVLDIAPRLAAEPFVMLLGSSRFRDIELGALSDGLADAFADADAGEPPRILQGAVLAGDAVVFDFLLERLIAQGTPPALAIMEMSPETLSYPAHWLEDHVTRMFTWRDLPAWLGEIVARGRLDAFLENRLQPIHVYRSELLGWLTLERGPYLRVPLPDPPALPDEREARRPARIPTGAHPVVLARATGGSGKPDAQTSSGLSRMREWLEDYRIGGLETRSLESALARCRAAGVRVVLVGVPVTSWHRDLYTPEILAAYDAYLGPLLEETGVRYLEFRDRVPDELFKDNHHLAPEGGAVFGRMLAREVIAPAWPHERP